MKVLNLVWTEFGLDYHAENFLFGNETAPDVHELLAMIREKYSVPHVSTDVCLQAHGSNAADELYKDIMQFCKDNGYEECEVPEVIVMVT